MKRIAIIGSGGAGKSTLARQIGEATGLPVVHLDREHWQPGWVSPAPDAWAARVDQLAAADSWVIDGNYGGTMDVRLERADTIVFMDLPRWLCVFRATKRALIFRDGIRPDMAPGCDEKLDWAFLKWIWDYPRTRRPGILVRLRRERAAGKRVVRLRSTRQVRGFIRWLEVTESPREERSPAQ